MWLCVTNAMQSRSSSLTAEMRQVLLRRLIHTLESVVLAENLKQQLGTPAQQQRFQELLRIEASAFD